MNGSEPLLTLIGGLPSGTPEAFEAAFGWGWHPSRYFTTRYLRWCA